MSCKLNIILDIPDEMRKEKWPDNCQGHVRLSNVAFDNLYFLQNLRKSLIVFYWLIFRQRYISIKYNMANINCNSSSSFRICRNQFWSGNMYLCWSDDFDLSSFCSIWRNFSNGEFRIPPFRSIFDSRSSPCVRSPCKDVPVSKYNVRPWKY